MNYLEIGNYKDLPPGNDRRIYRFLEMLPGILVWGTFLLVILLSFIKPIWVAVFIIAFDLYWLFKVVYFSIHTRSAYRRMKKYMKIDWLSEVKKLSPRKLFVSGQWSVVSGHDIWHLVILPMHKEPYEVVRPAIEAISSSSGSKDKVIIVVSVEESAGAGALETANRLRGEFLKRLPRFYAIVHPSGLPGEIPGKGSNENWAGKWALKEIIDPAEIHHEAVVVSSLDADTVIYPQYFNILTYHYLTAENPLRSSYQPIPLFINNIWEAPAVSRVIAFSSSFWHIMNQGRPEKLFTFSSHAMPLKALVDVGFWQGNVVAEDTQIFWQCFLKYNGDYRTIPLYYPLSMDANVTPSFWRTLKNIYKQQRRWAYGITDVSYFIFGFLKNKNLPFKLFIHHLFYRWEGMFSWATHAIIILILGWMPLFFGGEAFNATVLSYNLPRVTRVLLTFAMLGLVSSAYLSILLLPPRPPYFGRWKYGLMALQWFLIPVTLIVFGSLPAIEAQTRLMLGRYLGFWPTEKFRK